MERQFGEKSYNPAPFRFSCLYSGRNDWYYNALMNRTLPGQILLSAYYTPMSVEQLSVELGVACVYLEEELKLLMECGFVKKEGKNRYRSTLLVLPKEYIETVYDKLDLRCAHKVADIIRALREKLPEIRRIGFGGSDLADTNLLWDLLAFVVVSGNSHYAATTASLKYEKDKNGVDRICWAENYRKEDNKYAAFSYAAQSFPYEDRHDSYTFIDFWLPEGRGHFEGLCSLTLEEAKKRCPVFSKKELAELCEIIKEEFDKAAVLVRDAVTESTALLVQHTPEDLQERAEKINPQIAPSSLVGWYGGAALHTGALDLPGEGTWAWIIGYTNEE